MSPFYVEGDRKMTKKNLLIEPMVRRTLITLSQWLQVVCSALLDPTYR